MTDTLIVDVSGSRIDAYLASSAAGLSRSYASTLIGEGRILVNGSLCKPSLKVKSGDVIEIIRKEPVMTDILPENIPLDIRYEDSDLLVINKPQGMVVHPAPGHYTGTLVHALLHYCEGQLSDINGVIRPGIIHRIDKDTSGLLIAVKNNDIHEKMAKLISSHEVVRRYRAVVHGVISVDKGTVDAPIGRSGSDRRRMAVTSSGKPSVSHFTVGERFMDATDLSLLLETGRTHQIRSHMAFIGHPIIGDPVYAGKRKTYGLAGQALHSTEITFFHPVTGKEIHVECELPPYYEDLLLTLRAKSNE